jgi:deoxyribodipyrimidine photo-lyase
MSETFAPTPEAALAHLHAVQPSRYTRTRNHIEGAVTRLSPYLTHGLLTVPQVLAYLQSKHDIDMQHKLVFELAWREFFHHAWAYDGEKIFESLHPRPMPDATYQRELPADITHGRTGVPVIDQTVRALYNTGYVHNHARMWLASYVVHLRKVHWRVGADWLYAHLLDGDLASNHLSWQWVAGTGSHKPYLFNAENVARYAPQAWHSSASVIDTSYAALDAIARSQTVCKPSSHAADGVQEPLLQHEPPSNIFSAPDVQAVAGQDVWLMHAWALADPPPGCLAVAVCDAGFHVRWPWSARRWRFVTERMTRAAPLRWWGSARSIVQALQSARSVRGIGNLHLGHAFDALALSPMPRAFTSPAKRCASFSSFWNKVQRSFKNEQSLQGELKL